MSPWVVVERCTKEKTYCVGDLAFEKERKVTLEQLEIMDVPSAWKEKTEPAFQFLPRLGRVELGEGVLVSQEEQVRSEPANVKARTRPETANAMTAPEDANMETEPENANVPIKPETANATSEPVNL